MKKLLLSVLTLGVVSAVAVGATSAYFSDTAVLGTNTIAAGKVDIDPKGEMAVGVGINGLLPGGDWGHDYDFEILNKESEVKYRFFDSNETETVGGFYDKIWVKVTRAHSDEGHDEDFRRPTPQEEVVYEGTLRGLYFDSEDSKDSKYDTLDKNESHKFKFQFKLDKSAGDVYQNAGASFKLTVEATQPGNGAW